MKHSAGILLYRLRSHGPEVLLVHPGGPFWARKDQGAWSIPKGEVIEGESAETAARREFEEETGKCPEGVGIELEPIRQSGGKTVFAWAVLGDFDPANLRSNTFAMEWPPRSGRMTDFPEVDRAEWFCLPTARTKINKAQANLLDQLSILTGSGS
ncbi:MAG: NUDIX domain-containing protein [Gemmatimonadota bacterium]